MLGTLHHPHPLPPGGPLPSGRPLPPGGLLPNPPSRGPRRGGLWGPCLISRCSRFPVAARRPPLFSARGLELSGAPEPPAMECVLSKDILSLLSFEKFIHIHLSACGNHKLTSSRSTLLGCSCCSSSHPGRESEHAEREDSASAAEHLGSMLASAGFWLRFSWLRSLSRSFTESSVLL